MGKIRFSTDDPALHTPLPVDPASPVAPPLDTVTGAVPTPGLVFAEDDPNPPFGERVKTTLQGAVAGAAEALPFTGAAVGAGFGAVAGAPTGPGALVTGGAGMALGARAGQVGRDVLLDFLDIPSPEDVPEELRPFRFGGEAVGGATSVGGIPFMLAKTGFKTGGRFLDNVIDTILRRPVGVAAAETASAVSAGVAEGVSETLAPGETGKRIVAGVAAGVLSPAALLLKAADASAGAFGRVAASFTESGREAAAATEIQRLMAEAGDDPVALSKALDAMIKQLPAGASPTSGQLTGNPVLQALESELSRRSAKFGREAMGQARTSLEVLRKSADALSASGDPGVLKEAAGIRATYFEDLISKRVAIAQADAVAAAEKLGATGGTATAELSRKTSDILDTSLQAARKEEQRLYADVPDGAAPVESILVAIDRIKANDLLPDEALPDLVTKFQARMLKAAEEGDELPSTIAELRLFRTRMLDEARKASAAGDPSQARIFGNLAESALDDLSAVTEKGGALEIARSYSKALNDVFTRTFVGDAQATASSGAQRLPPELLLRRAAGTGQELGALRMQELRRAAEFGTPGAAEELLGAQEQFLRNAAEALIDTETGLVSARRLATFRRRNGGEGGLLEAFPEFSKQLENAESAQRFLTGSAKAAKTAETAITKRAAFARVAQAENPVVAVNRILAGQKPQEEFRQLAVLARRDGDAAVAGLQRSVMDDAFQRAGGDTDAFSFDRFSASLFEGRRPGQPSAVELMQRNGVIDMATAGRLKSLIDQAKKINDSITSGEGLDDLLENGSGLFDTVVRIVGASAGSQAAALTGGQSTLIAASAGSRLSQRALEKVPTGRVQDVLIEAAKDPTFMAILLQRGKNAKQRINIGLKLNAFLFNLGLVQGPADLAEQQAQEQQ